MLSVVVAHKEKNLDWLNALTDAQINIYSVAEKLPPNAVRSPDFGAESGAYLSYIVKNYDQLEDVTLFTQDDPVDHCREKPFATGLVQLRQGKIPSGLLLVGDERIWSAQSDLCMDWMRPSRWPRSPFIRYRMSRHLMIQDFWRAATEGTGVYAELPDSWTFSYGAILAATRENIRARPISLYKNLVKLLSHDGRPFEAILMERLWPVILRGA